ncbi:MAG: FAD-dependent monooxygenase [Verrucomicrobiota bacterium]|jgi:2-polyprenyl-6-methoxyphenol hydroxylase-like FAD-dependent oxidoreductase
MAVKPLTIVGGGLAGLTLGIGLRRRGVPVTVWEAGHYPRHRVCGEFISGRGQETLSQLGLRELLERAGAVHAGTVAFFSATQFAPPHSLPARAICLSRFVMDQLLANEFQKLGGELRVDQRWPVVGVHASACPDRLKPELQPEGVVHATGRRLQTEKGGSRWFGLKAHARNVPLTADLEMHVSPRGYVGLCRVEGGAVNVCGLFRRHAGAENTPQNWRAWLRGQNGSPLNRRLAAAEFDERSFCAVAGISLRPQRAAARAECCVGDAITMIPPVTGNGMSMAFESAGMSVEPLAAWSRGEISWTQTRQTLASRCDAAFARRLAWAKWLQRMMLAPSLQIVLVRFVSRSEWFWRTAFERTR